MIPFFVPMKNLIPYVSLFVAVVTVGALIWNGCEARVHYRQIVTPLVLAQVTSSPLDGKLGIFLRNEGIGPAEINYLSATLDGHPMSLEKISLQMIKEGVVFPEGSNILWSSLSRSYLKEGAEISILAFTPKAVVPSAQEEFDAFIHHRIDIRYQWCSVYDKCIDSCTALQCVP